MNKKERILVVEDDRLIQNAILRLCGDFNIEVLQAFDLKQAQELFLANQDVDGIIWDGKLPDGESPSLIEGIISKGYKGPMVANAGDPYVAEKQMKNGCTIYGGKRYSIKDLLKKMGLL